MESRTDETAPKVEKPPSRSRPSQKTLTTATVQAMSGQDTGDYDEWFGNPHRLMGLSKEEHDRLLETGQLIHDMDKDQELLLIARTLLLCGLPYRMLKDKDGKPIMHYRRVVKLPSGYVALTVAGVNPEIPLPFGSDRAVLAWLQTKARKTKNPIITWSSATDFFEAFQLGNSGPVYRQFRESWRRLSNAVFSIETLAHPDAETTSHMIPLFETSVIPAMRDSKKEPNSFTEALLAVSRVEASTSTNRKVPYHVELSPTLFKHLLENAVPLRLEVMRHFHDEPKGWDIVALICWRSWVCENDRRRHRNYIARIPWVDLVNQLGSVDKNHKQLRTSIRHVITKLKTVWPECQVELEHGGTLVVAPPFNSIHPVRDQPKLFDE